MKKLLTTLIAIFCIVRAQGSTVLTEHFDYPDGGIVSNSTSIWMNNSGTAGSMIVTNGKLVLAASRGEDIARRLSGAPYVTNGPVLALYASYVLKCANVPTTVQGTYFAHFSGANTFGAMSGHRARVFASLTNNAGLGAEPGRFFIGVVNTAGNPLNGTWGTTLTTNREYKVVTRYILATGESTLWIDPSKESDVGAVAADPLPWEFSGIPTNGILNVSYYSFRQAGGYGTILIDDVAVGTSFSDVVGPNAPSTISAIGSQAIPANSTTGPLPFTVFDDITPSTDLLITTSSTNTALVPNGTPNILIGGSGTNRTITITPVAGQQGSTTITLTVSDGVNSSFINFLLTVGAPTISSIPDQFVITGSSLGAIPFTVGDAETPNALTVVGSSSNPTLVQAGKIVISGSGASRSVVITPEAGESGVADITLTVNDGTLTASTRFTLAVHPALGVQFSDTFPYPDGLITVGSSSVWLSHSGGAANDALIVDFKLVLNYTNAMDVNAYFRSDFLAATPASGTVLYSKFNVKFLSLPGTNGGSYFAHFKDTGISNFRGRVYALTDGAAAGKFRLGVANQSGSVSSVYPQDLDLNTTYTVVTRIVVANGKSTLWINPRTESSDSVTATDQTGGTDLYTYCFRQDSGIGVLTVDDLVIGTTFTEAVPYVAPPSPIPLQIELMGGQIMLTWTDASFKLQSSSSINGPYTDVPGGTSGYMVPATGATYYRLKY